MKNVFGLLVVVLLCVTSCTTFKQSASQRNVAAPIVAVSYADLDVSDQKITYTLRPTKKVRKGGLQNCINVAIAEALKANGGGDILVETQEAIVERVGFLGKKIKSVTVTGYPAKYKNFRPASTKTIDDAFVRGIYGVQSAPESGKKGSVFGFFK